MGKKRIQTTTSGEAMRWADDREGGLERAPGPEGNLFDVQMQAESDGLLAAEKIVGVLKDRGVCLTEANAPQDLLLAAHKEAEALWEAGAFGPPMPVQDQESEWEAQLWQQVLYHEDTKVLWVNEEYAPIDKMRNLKLLAQNMTEFAQGLGQFVEEELGLRFNHIWDAMISCYTGTQSYTLHIDNPHAGSEEQLPDNGLRLTLTYYINPHWDPDSRSSSGGLDVYLTNPKETPGSMAAARRAKKMRIAPHADTLAIFLSERMAHQVLPTKGKERWFCLTIWALDEEVLNEFPMKVHQMREEAWEGSGDEVDEVD